MLSRPFLINLAFTVLAGAMVWTNYAVVEDTRVTNGRLKSVAKQIDAETIRLEDAQTRYMALSSPDRIQSLAQAMLGMSDTATVQLSSLQMLPRRDEAEVHDGEVVTAQGTESVVKIAAHPED